MEKMTLKVLTLLALLLAAGCETMPTGPSVMVLPAPGKAFDQFMTDDALCRQWAGERIGMSPGETASNTTVKGAAVGTLVGAGAGAALGAAAGNPGAGAAIGGGSGLLLGTAAGSGSGRYSGNEAQRRYDIGYVQCMYAKGNQVPGVRARTRSPSYPVPPDYQPPPPK
ncbi:glycine zipper family protein [Geomonas sp. Red32]|uniref:glycine zipper family protein n=1 Tax=Geomonas sp. Red32 TaxID=2912856 RepID=UPI00202CCC43|nr:glycine zipper family protein [Geomonas sp. Red32]MCM0082836.1 glycine zipper family protein [Geomonas sp. Red32]